MNKYSAKEAYESPEMSVILLKPDDLINTSGNGDEISSDMSHDGWTGW